MCPVSTAQSAVIDIAVLNCVISMASANLTANFCKVSISAPQCVLSLASIENIMDGPCTFMDNFFIKSIIILFMEKVDIVLTLI